MTMLTAVSGCMDSNGWPAPTTGVASSTDQNLRQAKSLLNKTVIFTSFKMNWPILHREYAFTTVPNQQDYPLPNDFHHWIVGSAWDADQYYSMKGSLTPALWYRAMYGGLAAQWFKSFRIDRVTNMFRVSPIPTSYEKLIFMYITKYIVADASGNPKTQYEIDSDVSLIDEDIVEAGLSWRWRQKKGMDFTAELAEYNGMMRSRYSQYLAAGEIDVGGPRLVEAPLTNGYIGWGPIGG